MKTNQPVVRELPKSVLQEGKGELTQVNFAYPTRKTAKIFDQIDLQIPAGKVVALVCFVSVKGAFCLCSSFIHN